jgi:peptidoglycan hydrolase-like protein with peptidoglycan-binding domain
MAPGDRGADVLAVQERLKELGYFSGYESGIYEDDLKKAIYKFQKDHSLKIKHTLTKPDYNAMGFFEIE